MRVQATRRQILETFVAAAGAAVVPFAAAQPRDARSPGDGLRVSVHEPGGAHLRVAATVSVLTAGGDLVRLLRTPPDLTYFVKLPAGTYRLRVSTDGSGLAPFDQVINVPAEGLSQPVYLGKPGWPAFHWGGSVIPFEPNEHLCAIAFLGRRPLKAAHPRLIDVAGRVGLEPFPNRDTFLSHQGTIATFQWKPGPISGPFFGSSRRDGPDVISRLSRELGSSPDVRIGMPIDMRPGHLKILDNEYVVRLERGQKQAVIESLSRKYGAAVRSVDGLDDTWVFAFANRSHYRSHLDKASDLAFGEDRGRLRYVEPRLIFELQQHSCTDATAPGPCTGTSESLPVDPWESCEQNLALQQVPQAWCFLEQRLGVASRFGDPSVCIATVDAAGINKDHPDVSGVEYVNQCNDCAEMPEDDHGMSVLGIVSAQPGNRVGTSGMSPGAHHVAVRTQRSWTEPISYSQLIGWVSGVAFASSMPRPLAHAAEIVVCSHGLADLPAPSIVSDMFNKATEQGRNQMGTILVYSSGNGSTDITGTQGFAAHPRVIAVGNTMPADDAGVEVRESHSNYGAPLSLCAQGEGAPSLLADPDVSVQGSCVPPRGNVNGAAAFGGTSAACPMVGATAALMLSVNPGLTWLEVRDRLRESAHCVDPENGSWIDHRSYFYGSGRLNAFEAVKAAVPMTPPGG